MEYHYETEDDVFAIFFDIMMSGQFEHDLIKEIPQEYCDFRIEKVSGKDDVLYLLFVILPNGVGFCVYGSQFLESTVGVLGLYQMGFALRKIRRLRDLFLDKECEVRYPKEDEEGYYDED